MLGPSQDAQLHAFQSLEATLPAMRGPMGSSDMDSGRLRSSCLDCADSDQPNRCPLGCSTRSGLCCGWVKNGFLFAHGRWNGDEGLDPLVPSTG